jgi:hypothetical protein
VIGDFQVLPEKIPEQFTQMTGSNQNSDIQRNSLLFFNVNGHSRARGYGQQLPTLSGHIVVAHTTKHVTTKAKPFKNT